MLAAFPHHLLDASSRSGPSVLVRRSVDLVLLIFDLVEVKQPVNAPLRRVLTSVNGQDYLVVLENGTHLSAYQLQEESVPGLGRLIRDPRGTVSLYKSKKALNTCHEYISVVYFARRFEDVAASDPGTPDLGQRRGGRG